MFRALLCPSSGARDYDIDYHIGCFVLGLLYVGGWVQLSWSGVRAAGYSLNKLCTKLASFTSKATLVNVSQS